MTDLVFDDIKEAREALKKYKGARMKAFETMKEAKAFLENPDSEESFLALETSQHEKSIDLSTSFDRLSIRDRDSPMKSPRSPNPLSCQPTQAPTKTPTKLNQTEDAKDEGEVETFPVASTQMLNKLRRDIEAGKYEEVEETIWSNPRCLVTVCDSATYLMAGPKYNACHIAARANKSDILALVLDTVTNTSFLRKLYPKEPDHNIQERINHLLDSYLNTPDLRQGSTPLHFACKFGFYRVVRVLLTFEGCDLTLRDSNGMTAEESICTREAGDQTDLKEKIRNMFKSHLHLPLYRDQLKKRLILAKRRNSAASADTSI